MTKEEIQQEIKQAVERVRAKTPLVPSITNSVTINLVANAQLAAGGSAAMVYLPDEGCAMAEAGDAMYINMGTLQPVYEKTLPVTAQRLHEQGKPWVLDPVGLGIGGLRTQLIAGFKACKPSIIRGNASEIIALARLWELQVENGTAGAPRGVDSVDVVSAAKPAAVALARWTGGAVAVSGETDMVTDGDLIGWSSGGSILFTKITGAGCSLGGVAAVYASVATPFIAALTATAAYNVAGQRSAQQVKGPGHFQQQFLDELYLMTPDDVAQNPLELEVAAL